MQAHKDTLLSHPGSLMGCGTAFAVHQALDQTGAFAGLRLAAAAVAWHAHGLGSMIDRLGERFGNLRSVWWLPKLAPETTKRSLEHTRSRR